MSGEQNTAQPMTAEDIGVGAPLPRYEDLRLVRGAGRYTDDYHVPGETHLVVVRSTHAAARIVSVDTSAARAVPGVLAVPTGSDSVADGLGLINCGVERKLADGSPMPRPPYHVLAVDEVRFVGDAVVAVVAETIYAAQEAADLVVVEYDDKPNITTAADAAKPDAPRLWPQHAPDNICYVVRNGNTKAVDEAFAAAAHVVRTEHRVSRVSTNAMEPRNAVGLFDPVEQRYTLHAGTQVPHRIRSEIAQHVLKIPTDKLRVVSLDVGGGFGMRARTIRSTCCACGRRANSGGRCAGPQRAASRSSPTITAATAIGRLNWRSTRGDILWHARQGARQRWRLSRAEHDVAAGQ